MKYSIRETQEGDTVRYRLYRYDEMATNSIPNNAEFEFWSEIERLREVVAGFNYQIGWVDTLNKAASALRFYAMNDEWLSEKAKEESRRIAENLTEIANCILKSSE